jgi:hypothetical protein
MGEAAVLPVGEPSKRRRVCNLAKECYQKMREMTRGNRESRRKLAAACMKVSRRANWHRKKKPRQENSDPGKSWIAERIGCRTQRDDVPCKSGTAQGTRSQEIRPGQCGTENSEETDVRDVSLERSGMQQLHEGPRPKVATTRQWENK